jgi:hypothetical protein
MIDTALVIVTLDPNPAESSATTSPPGAAALTAAWKVLHGAVRLQGFASLPVLATKVLTCAEAADASRAISISGKSKKRA